jgi:hypothetical protein
MKGSTRTFDTRFDTVICLGKTQGRILEEHLSDITSVKQTVTNEG